MGFQTKKSAERKISHEKNFMVVNIQDPRLLWPIQDHIFCATSFSQHPFGILDPNITHDKKLWCHGYHVQDLK